MIQARAQFFTMSELSVQIYHQQTLNPMGGHHPLGGSTGPG